MYSHFSCVYIFIYIHIHTSVCVLISSSGIVVDGHAKQLLAEVSGLPPLALGRRQVVSSIRRIAGFVLDFGLVVVGFKVLGHPAVHLRHRDLCTLRIPVLGPEIVDWGLYSGCRSSRKHRSSGSVRTRHPAVIQKTHKYEQTKVKRIAKTVSITTLFEATQLARP